MTKIYTFLILLFCSSCSYRYYVPTTVDLSNLQEQGDLEITAGIGANGIGTINWGASAAFSPLRKLGLMANFSRIKPAVDGSTTSGYTAEAALGTYFASFGRREHLNLDIYAIYGRGNIVNRYATLGISRLNFQKYFGQLAFHATINERMSYSSGLRIGTIIYESGRISDNIPANELKLLNKITDIGNLWIVEWTSRIEIGREPLRFFGEFRISDSGQTTTDFSIPFVTSFGAVLKL